MRGLSRKVKREDTRKALQRCIDPLNCGWAEKRTSHMRLLGCLESFFEMDKLNKIPEIGITEQMHTVGSTFPNYDSTSRALQQRGAPTYDMRYFRTRSTVVNTTRPSWVKPVWKETSFIEFFVRAQVVLMYPSYFQLIRALSLKL